MVVRAEDKSRFSPSNRCFTTMPFSTAGETDVLECGGLALAGIELSTGVSASLLAFNGSMSSTGNMVPIHNVIGGRITLGSTSGMAGKMIVIDPPMFAALRYLQVATITSTGGTVAQTTADSVRICLTDRR